MQDNKPTPGIRLRGIKQNNLRNLDVDFEYGKLTVVTGVSGSGKSSLVFDTLYAEGQRRYIETFSPYIRQFLDRMDRPKIDRIEGVPPAIAVDQVNPVKTSRSTVGTMTEINDHLKLLFAQSAKLYCEKCGQKVEPDTPTIIWQKFQKRIKKLDESLRAYVVFHVSIPLEFPIEEAIKTLNAEGFTRVNKLDVVKNGKTTLEVISDRFKINVDKSRATESFELALLKGKGKFFIRIEDKEGAIKFLWKFSEKFSCPDCEIAYSIPHESTFTFNSPLGACETCRGFGRIIDIDYDLVIPDKDKTLENGAVKPWTTDAYAECQKDLLDYAKKDGVSINTPFKELPIEHQQWVLEGDPKWTNWNQKRWYGVRHFFNWLETKTYKMHVRVLLSRYRSYNECPSCHGSRLKPEALLWRIGTSEMASKVLGKEYQKTRPTSASFSDDVLMTLPGLNIYDLVKLPINKVKAFFNYLEPYEKNSELIIKEICSRLNFLDEVGLGYLTLDRQSRTLSGGEVQRINLTTALGTSLTNTLFVLDEPSIGLHPQDMNKINTVMQRLKGAGNTLVVVDHDPQVMMSADRILDMGPGPGIHGGSIVFDGTPSEILKANTLTGRYLRGTLKISKNKPRKITVRTPALVLLGAKEHNLKNIDIRFPLQSLVCIAGVSGSGKSTLIQNTLIPALLKAKKKTTESPGSYDKLLGDNFIDDIAFVDQNPISKTTRSNPAIFVGAFDPIRKLFASTPLAKARGYTAGTFSFNSGTGRCPSCEGSGYEHIEMQFLSDVYLCCSDCQGKRYKPETLEVTIEVKERKLSISDVLNLTIQEALTLFDSNKEIVRTLSPLQNIGLGYLKLGQPTPTLSGGEAQRLKLAKYLIDSTKNSLSKTLFIFDEPTTGLHFEDISKLMKALKDLIDAGHSVIVVEHNLDVISSSDWVIELGPEGGDKGGFELFAGPPSKLAIKETPTGLALADYYQSSPSHNYFDTSQNDWDNNTNQHTDLQNLSSKENSIVVINARENNLKNISVNIPRNCFTVVTGVSGSGKSTLAFDIVFNEGQRRYLESLNAYARSIIQPASRPNIDAIYGIPPTVAIEQRTSRGGFKSTVATLTEIYHFLRLLFVKLGIQHCPNCHIPIEPMSFESIFAQIMEKFQGQEITLVAPLVKNRKGTYKDLASWAKGKLFQKLLVDNRYVSTHPFIALDRYREHNIGLPVATIVVESETKQRIAHALKSTLDFGKGLVEIRNHLQLLEVFSTKRGCPECGKSFSEPDPRLFSYNSKIGWCPTCLGNGISLFKDAIDKDNQNQEARDDLLDTSTCLTCHGTRLNDVARHVLFQGQSIADIASMTVEKAELFFRNIQLDHRSQLIAEDIIKEIVSRLDFLKEVGLSYLNLDRSAPTLSGGEAQRIRLASQLGTNLQGVCYVLDEPTIGLHPHDNKILLNCLKKLTSKGNSLLVVEHDEDTISRADHIIDIGPGAGTRGGNVIAQGTIQDIMNSPDSLTGRYLKHPLHHSGKAKNKTKNNDPVLKICGATKNNLKQVTTQFPLNRLIAITGISGSGKSTLVRDLLLNNLRTVIREKNTTNLQNCKDLIGWEQISRVLEVDQTPIGKTSRSCPATYIGFWDDIRKLFAGINESQIKGFTASRFSFNLKEGRCDACEGQGVKTLEMSFMPNVKVVCDVCNSMRFNEETLHIQWKGKSIGEILKMEVDEAVEFFSSQRSIAHPLKLMQEVGLGYLTLGQPSPTLSGGEAQRIKLISELAKIRNTNIEKRKEHVLYILDEPTVGLHMSDVDNLIKVLHHLVDSGNTVIVIEHDLDVIAEADWIIDMGPSGGSNGGQVVFSGPPQDLVKQQTFTAEALRVFLKKERN